MLRSLLGGSTVAALLLVSCGPDGAQESATRPRIGTFALEVSADAVVTDQPADDNFGDKEWLEVRKQGHRRTVLGIDTSAIEAAVGSDSLVSARLELTIQNAAGSIPDAGKTVHVHALARGFSEAGVTWSCPHDTDTSNGSPDCDEPWDMTAGAWDPAVLAAATIHKHDAGTISLDVTAHVTAILSGTAENHGWLIKGDDEDVPGHIRFDARESGTGPRLVIETMTSVPDTSTGADGGDSTIGGGDVTAASHGGTGGSGAGDDADGGDAGGDDGGEPPVPAGTVQGRVVRGDTGDGVGGVLVSIGEQVSYTDNSGTFVLHGVAVGEGLVLTATVEGFSTGSTHVDVADASTSDVEMALAPSEVSVVPDAAEPGIVSTPDGVTIDLPPMAFQDAAGNPVVGPIEIQTTVIDAPEEMDAAPGDMIADVGGGAEAALESFGMVEFKITQNGEPLELAPGTTATIRIPLSPGHGFAQGDPIGLWHFAEEDGVWVQEGLGTADGDEMVATVGHFSWWNADQPIESTGCVTGRLVDDGGAPIGGASLTLQGVDYNGQSSDSTAGDGTFCMDGLSGGTARVTGFAFDPGLGMVLEWSSADVGLGTAVACDPGGCTDIGDLVADFTAYTCVGGTVPGFVDLNPTPNVADTVLSWRFETAGVPTGEAGDVIGETILDDRTFCLSAEIGAADTVVVETACGAFAVPLQQSAAACGSDDCQQLDLAQAFACQEPPPGGTGGSETGGAGMDGADMDAGADAGGFPMCPDPDADGDGLTVCQEDCDDTAAATYPSAVELCDDGLDTDCDGYGDAIPPEPGCVTAIAGESCNDFIDLGLGGVYSGDLSGAIGDEAGCFGGPDHVLRFHVPEGPPRQVSIIGSAAEPLGLTLVADDCRNGPQLACSEQGEGMLPPGQYWVYVESMGGGPDGTYTVTISQTDPDTGECVPANDSDADGWSACGGDCDDGDPQINPGAHDVCGDGVDNDCNGSVDHPEGACATALPGVCATGAPECVGSTEICLQTMPATDEVCGDALDNDCDGTADEDGSIDPADACETLGPGLACASALDLDASDLRASGTFEGAFDSVSGGCNDGARDVVARFTVPTSAAGEMLVRFHTSSSELTPMGEVSYALYAESCGDPAALEACVGWEPGDYEAGLPAGTYYVVASAWEPTSSWQIQIGLTDPADGSCVPGDLDADGTSACELDCDDDDPSVNQGQVEVCGDGADNDCNGVVDQVWGPCATGLAGACAVGQRACDGAGEVCNATIQPGAQDEICADGVDNDCDGSSDEAGCATLPAGETCELPIDLGFGGSASGDFVGRTADVESFCGPPGGLDVVLSFQVPDLGPGVLADVHVSTAGSQDVAYSIFRDACGDPGMLAGCFEGMGQDWQFPLEPGTYYVVATPLDPAGGTAVGQWAVSITMLDPQTGACVVTDGDGDTFDPCTGDCAEGDPSSYPGATEACDGADNDCNGVVDDPGGTCVVGGQVGACAEGVLACSGGAPTCVQTVFGGVEICGNAIDDDCDGEGEGVEDPDCLTTGVGDTCMDAIDLGFGGSHTDTLAAASDTTMQGCGSGVDHFVRFEVPGPSGDWDTRITTTGAPSTSFTILGGGDCGMLDEQDCFGPGQYQPPFMQEGVYWLLVSSSATDPAELGYSVSIASFHHPTGTCTVGDADLDGRSICQGDCDDADPAVFPGQAEDCGNGIDDDCDGAVDDFSGGSCTTGQPGICAQGHLSCAGGTPECVPDEAPQQEVCGDGLDRDCDGADDSVGCVSLPAGEHCGNAIDVSADGIVAGDLSTATDDLQNHCGMNDAVEHVYRFDVPASGDQYEVRLLGQDTADGCIEVFHIAPEEGGCDPTSGGMWCMPGLEWWQPAQPGTHHLVVQAHPSCTPEPYAFQLALRNASQGTCDLPLDADADGDGSTVCDQDCDDSNAARFPGNAETCDAIDNDCDNFVDELDVACDTGLAGICAAGHLQCYGTGVDLCVQSVLARDEVCADTLDNDCDGVADGGDAQGCVAYPPGSCDFPYTITPGNVLTGDLATASDELDGSWCGPQDGPEDVLRLVVPAGASQYEVAFDFTGSGDGIVVALSSGTCGEGDVIDCFDGPMMMGPEPHTRLLPPGTYDLVVTSHDVMMWPNYALTVTLTPL